MVMQEKTDDIYSYIRKKLDVILKKTLLSVVIFYLAIIVVAITFLKFTENREKKEYISKTLDITYWYLVREADSEFILKKTIDRISTDYNINIFVTFNSNEYDLEKSRLCSNVKNIFSKNNSCSFKVVNASNRKIYIIYSIKSFNISNYIYFFTLVFLIVIFVTYVLFFRFLNIKRNFSTIIEDENKSRAAVEKVFSGNEIEAKEISKKIVIKNFLYNYELAVNAKMKLALKHMISDDLEKKIHDLNKDIDRVIKFPFNSTDGYLSFLEKTKYYFFDHNNFHNLNLKDIILEKIGTLELIGYKVDYHIDNMIMYEKKYIIYKIFTNIISNIIEHSKYKKVSISSEYNDEFYIVKIRNYGSFILSENYENIFVKNYTSKPYNFKSCGSGLYDTKQIILEIGGNISVESEFSENIIDSWTEFKIHLPKIKLDNKFDNKLESNFLLQINAVIIDDEPHLYEDWKELNNDCNLYIFSNFDDLFNQIDSKKINIEDINLVITDYYFDKIRTGMTLFSSDFLDTLKDIYDYKGPIILATNGSSVQSPLIDAVIGKSSLKIEALLRSLSSTRPQKHK